MEVKIDGNIVKCTCAVAHCEYIAHVETRDAFGNVAYMTMFPLGINTRECLENQANRHLVSLPFPLRRKENLP